MEIFLPGISCWEKGKGSSQRGNLFPWKRVNIGLTVRPLCRRGRAQPVMSGTTHPDTGCGTTNRQGPRKSNEWARETLAAKKLDIDLALKVNILKDNKLTPEKQEVTKPMAWKTLRIITAPLVKDILPKEERQDLAKVRKRPLSLKGCWQNLSFGKSKGVFVRSAYVNGSEVSVELK